MNDTQPQPPAPADAPQPGFLSALAGIWFEPGATFAALLPRPRWVAPLLLMMAMNLGFTAIWMQKVDPSEFMRLQNEKSPRWEQVPPERREAMVEQQVKFFRVFAWLGPAVFAPLFVVIVAGIFLFVFRFFYATETTFKQSLTVVAWVFAAVSVISSPLMLGVLALKGDWNLNPQEVLQANPTLLLDQQATAKPLWAAASSLDLFSFWMLFLLAAGYAASARKRASWALPGVIAPWALWVLGKIGVAFLF